MVKQYNFTTKQFQSQNFKVAKFFQNDTTIFKYLANMTNEYLSKVTFGENTFLKWQVPRGKQRQQKLFQPKNYSLNAIDLWHETFYKAKWELIELFIIHIGPTWDLNLTKQQFCKLDSVIHWFQAILGKESISHGPK